ncbi:MAG: hypothetical protein PQJ46_01575, partial [Spirochaetales bacterium]|nr:hypothetical protein [Spirochaetales bacterium]
MRAFRLLTFIFLLVVVSFNCFASNDVNRQIGIIYLKNAASKYLNNEYSSAENFLEKADEFYPVSSDKKYIKALIQLKRDNNIVDSIQNMRDALERDKWLLFDKKRCIEDLTQLLFRTKKYEDIIDIINSKMHIEYEDKDLMYIYILCYKNIGDNDIFYRMLKENIKSNIDDYRFGELYVDYDDNYSERVLNGEIKFKNKDGGLEVFYKAAMNIKDDLKRKKALQSYLSQGGKNIEAKIEFYKLEGLISEDDLDSILKQNIFENPDLKNKLLSIVSFENMKNKINNAWSTYTGNIYYDYNGDKYYEELHLYDNGQPAGISIDNNQDGIIEDMI